MLRNARPLRFSPQGVSDSLAEEDAFPGACTQLANLIPDPSTKNLWTVRPASTSLTTFGGFTSPSNVTVMKVIGSFVYGLVSETSGTYSGFDVPFCYNLLTSTFVTVTGFTTSNLPTTQSTSGDWTPPTIDIMGVFVVMTHPGFDGVTNFFGSINVTNPAAPVWSAGNFSLITPLATVTIVSGGSGYDNGTYNNVPLIPISGADPGSGALATVVVSGNAVTSVTVTNGGVGYVIGTQLTIYNTIIGPSGSGVSLTVATVVGSAILSAIILGAGTGYTNGSYSGVALTSFQGGSGATANIIVSGTGVTSFVIASGGSGYVVGEILYISGHAITAFKSIVNAGSGYTNGTYTNIALVGGHGTGATANITVSAGSVSAISVNNGGSGYNVNNTLSVQGGLVSTIVNYIITSGAPVSNGTFVASASSTSWALTTSGNGIGLSFSFTVLGGAVTTTAIITPGFGYNVNDELSFGPANVGIGYITASVGSISSSNPIGPGTGFTIGVNTVSSYPIGNGTGFSGQVFQVQNPGGFIAFTTVPSWVRQFNGRSWWGINPTTGQPSIIYSDVYALNCTNANQALLFGDNTPLTAAAGLGLANLLGGVIQALIVFKSLNGIIQITGDATTANLSVNQIPGGSGTISPRSLCEHPQGLIYLDHDGFRMVTLDGNCSDPIGFAGSGVVEPFLNPTTPSRVNAACNGSVLRASVKTSGGTWEEFWYDSVRKVWSGPHALPSTMIDTYEGAFILVAQSAPAALFRSSVVPETGSTYTENGSALSWIFQTTVLVDNQQMAESEICEMQVKTTDESAAGLTSITVKIIDQNGTTIATDTYTYPGTVLGLAARRIDFSQPVVYNRMAIEITGTSVAGFQIGDTYVRARALGYIQMYA